MDHARFRAMLQELLILSNILKDSTGHCKDLATLHNLADLDTWLRAGKVGIMDFTLPNLPFDFCVTTSQLVSIGGVIRSHLRRLTPCGVNTGPTESCAETFGLCTGLLTAADVSGSRSNRAIKKHRAVAMRLAMLIGIIADAQGTNNASRAPSRSFPTAWASPKANVSLEKVLALFPEAHSSVRVDNPPVTRMAPSDVTASPQQKLTLEEFVIATLSFCGRLHSTCHPGDLDRLIKVCRSDPSLQLQSISDMVLPRQAGIKGGKPQAFSQRANHSTVHSILINQADYYASFEALTKSPSDEPTCTLRVPHTGFDWYIPEAGPRKLQSSGSQTNTMHRRHHDSHDDAIAVIGMSCKVPGANDLDEFWELLSKPKSQHIPLSETRFNLETSWRESGQQQWYGNFVDQSDSFDHKFFQKSPREMAATDPQHRMMLQCAYQAVEQSGYFTSKKTSKNKHVGCYIGVANADYECNVACHPANAYSATGNLKSFTSGKISHYFGWTGPSLTVDTACSASMVAIHCACKAILSNECTGALAGGVNVMTNPDWFHNLAGAAFLSPTGQCKPFDSKADGYCRAEGVGAVFLKKLSAAINDGDQIIGVIRGSAVYQNGNCTGITVPNTPSLSDLFKDVLQQAGICPTQISVVEAHAPGTAVGDPVEYDSIRKVCGGPQRSDTLFVGSAKAIIGHAECASGIISLIKTLMMIKNQTITPQAGLQQINPALCYSPEDKISISTETRPWKSEFRAAMVNNYGASGSNACLVITEPPRFGSEIDQLPMCHLNTDRYPFMFCGNSENSLRAYITKFLSTIASNPSHSTPTLRDLSFQLSRQSNKTLQNAFIVSSSTHDELERKLREFQMTGESQCIWTRKPAKPVILCFGGQSSTFVGLNQDIYNSTAILRKHLDECDKICQSLGLTSLYPYIFQQTPIDDTVLLQTALFSIQYACARSWMDCGVEIAAVVGLSFGELTALCISGALSLYETMEMVAGRAETIQRCWGAEKGSMMAVEGDIRDVHRLLLRCDRIRREQSSVCIACFTGPRNFTLAGSSKGIEIAQSLIKEDSSFSELRCKKLNVTYAFHSALADPLLSDLHQAGSAIVLKRPTIHFERATETETDLPSDCRFLAEHIRQPAFYSHAVQRLAQRYPSAIWLEAGTNSSIANLTSRALGSPMNSLFQSVNISNEGAMRSLTDATINLWRHGLNCSFWMHHTLQASEYCQLLLPPYQFENHKHWMELKKPSRTSNQTQTAGADVTARMWTFAGYDDFDRRSARFQIDTHNPRYLELVHGHKVAQAAPICSSTVQLELAMDTLMSLRADFADPTFQPELRRMENISPMVLDCTRSFWLKVEAVDDRRLVWHWAIVSAKDGCSSSTHVTGEIRFRATCDPLLVGDFGRYDRLVSHQRCKMLLEAEDADEVMQGQGIYRSFTDILVYDKAYKGLRKIVGRGCESAGRVTKPWVGDTWIDSGLLDAFCQVAGMYVNNMTDRGDDEMYISSGIEQFIRSPHYYDQDMRSDSWEVYANNHRLSAKEFVSDVFIFDARTGVLAEVILGIKYTKVSRAGLGKLVLRLTNVSGTKSLAVSEASSVCSSNGLPFLRCSDIILTPPSYSPTTPTTSPIETLRRSSQSLTHSMPELFSKIQMIIADLSGLSSKKIQFDSRFEDMGFDSLMNMELAREIEKAFGRTFDVDLFVDLHTVARLVEFLQAS